MVAFDKFVEVMRKIELDQTMPFNMDSNFIKVYFGKDKKRLISYAEFSQFLHIIAALRFFASGFYQMNIGKNIYMGISQPTISRSIHEIINIITRPEIMNQ